MKLEDLQVYQLSMSLGDRIWDIVVNWEYFAKDTIGKQLVKAADSVASNISEGYGRFHDKESKHFGYYDRGSLYDTKPNGVNDIDKGVSDENSKDRSLGYCRKKHRRG
jgi:hypothetical protein